MLLSVKNAHQMGEENNFILHALWYYSKMQTRCGQKINFQDGIHLGIIFKMPAR